MMGLGCGANGAGGNSSSSTSNLSASAPPFTVDRSNPLLHYPELSYGLEPFSHTWTYTNSSSHKPELDIHSTRTTSFPLSDDYRVSSAMSKIPSPTHLMAFSREPKTSGNTLAYDGGVKSYYPPSVPPMENESGPLVEDVSAYTHSVFDRDYRTERMRRLESNQFFNGQQSKIAEFEGSFSRGREKVGDVTALIDYTYCAIDQDYMPQQMDDFNINGVQCRRVELDESCSSGMANVGEISAPFDYTQSAYDQEYRSQQMDSLNINGNLYKRVEVDGNFSSERAEIGGSHFYLNPVKEGCGSGFGDKSGEIYGRCNWGTEKTDHTRFLTVKSKDDKLSFEQNPSFPVSSSTCPESRPLSLSYEMHKNLYNYKNSCSPYEKRGRSDDSAFTSSTSVTRSSPTVVIMPPPAIHDNLGHHNDSRKPTENDNVAGVCSVQFDCCNPSNKKYPGPKPSSEIKEGNLDPKFSKQCYGRGFLSSSVVNELSVSLHINDTFDGNIKERFSHQISDSNFSCGLAMADDRVQVVNSIEDSSDFIDYHNTAVDSPCWKGATSSQFSAFDIEAGSSHNFIRKLNENYGFDEAKHNDVHSLDDPTRAFPTNAGQNDKNDENVFVKHNVVLPLESILDANHPTKEQILSDDAKAENFMVNGGNGLEMPRTNSNYPEDLNCGSHTKISATKHLSSKEEVGMDLNDASESSGAIAFHVVEKVLASPSSQEDATEHVKLQPDSKIKTTIKTMKYLSEMLVSHLSHDACALEEEDILALKHTISNLDAYMSSKVSLPRDKREPSNPMGYLYGKFGVP